MFAIHVLSKDTVTFKLESARSTRPSRSVVAAEIKNVYLSCIVFSPTHAHSAISCRCVRAEGTLVPPWIDEHSRIGKEGAIYSCLVVACCRWWDGWCHRIIRMSCRIIMLLAIILCLITATRLLTANSWG